MLQREKQLQAVVREVRKRQEVQVQVQTDRFCKEAVHLETAEAVVAVTTAVDAQRAETRPREAVAGPVTSVLS